MRKKNGEHGWRVLTDYYHLLRKWEATIPPRRRTRTRTRAFWRPSRKKTTWGYLLDTFLDSSTEEQDQWIAEHTAEISAIEGE